MEVDVSSPAIGALSRSAPVERNVLLQEKQLKLRGDREKNIYKKLKTRDFVLTPAYDLALFQATGMLAKFELIFRTIGWEDAWGIDEPGCKLLTIEFLCTLQPTNSEVSFRLLGKNSISWKKFSELLGFHSQCIIDVDSAIQEFDRNKFWREISTEIVCYRPRTNEIHHPTLQFMHKWLGFSIFPRSDFHIVEMMN